MLCEEAQEGQETRQVGGGRFQCQAGWKDEVFERTRKDTRLRTGPYGKPKEFDAV
jgi:hypothetical protein